MEPLGLLGLLVDQIISWGSPNLKILGKLMTNGSDVLKKNPVSYSIWLMPEGNVKYQLKKAIYMLSTDFDGPIFTPHVTLVSSFLGSEKELLQKTEIISKKIKPFEISFGDIEYSGDFFRSLFLKIKVNTKLKTARDIACKELNWNENDYMPHLSLVYGDYNRKEKEQMISTIKIIPDWFLVDHIFLAHNDEINLKWKVIQGYPLIN